MIRYWPVPSVTAERTRSISAGLVASTVAPGNSAPLESLTTPVRDPCAIAVAGTNANARTNSFTNWRDERIPWTPSVDEKDVADLLPIGMLTGLCHYPAPAVGRDD